MNLHISKICQPFSEKSRCFDVLEHQSDVADQRALLMSQLEDLSERCEELEHDGFLVAVKRRYDALGRRYDALGRRVDVLDLKFFTQMYKEHVALQKNTKPCTGTSTTRHFPFTKQGLNELKEHERLRRVDAKKMHAEDRKRLVEVLGHQRVVVKQLIALATQLDDLSERDEELGHDDALRRQYNALNRQHDALERQCDALGRRVVVLEQRADVLERRLSAYKPTLKFINQMYKEHLAQQKNTEPCAAAPTCHKH
ncbi:hypothetical protein Tco_1559618 [Tanacetum coccineum]